MTAGDVTILGPYNIVEDDVAAAFALSSAYTHANDKWVPLVFQNTWYVVLVSGA